MNRFLLIVPYYFRNVSLVSKPTERALPTQCSIIH